MSARGPLARALVAALLLLGAPPARAAAAQTADQRESTVGLPARIDELVLPGSELEAAPQDAGTAVLVRVLAARPHGSDVRYDLEWTGFEPGAHDLAAYLRRKDGSPTAGLPPIPVQVRSVLGVGQVKPHPPGEGPVPRFGGYRALLVAGGLVWVAGLVALLVAGRRRRVAAQAAARPPRTLAERLKPLVERAARGELSSSERAQLEGSLVAYWRRRLELDHRRPDEAHRLLRAHAEAGPLLASLEDWLHRPVPREDVDVAALLAPYRDLPPDALEPAAGRSA